MRHIHSAKSAELPDDDGFSLYSPAVRRHETEIAAPEAALLRAIERALERQRRQEEVAVETPPLIRRIETILDKPMEAANDAYPALDIGSEDLFVASPALTGPEQAQPAGLKARPDASWPSRLALLSGLAVLGALVPTFLPTGPALYRAEAMLDVADAAGSPAAQPEALARQIASPRMINRLVSTLRLDRDPEFAGREDALAILVDLLSPSGKAADPVSRAEAVLSSSITTGWKDDVVTYGVSTRDKMKSARIAAEIAAQLSAVGAPAQPNGLKTAKDETEAALNAFVSKSGEGNVKAVVALRRRIEAAEEDLKTAGSNLSQAQAGAERLKKASPDEVVAAAFPASLMSASLQEMRDRYAVVNATIASLSVDLGPRHPKLVASRTEADALKAGITKELARLQRQAEQQAREAAAAEKRIGEARNALIAQSRDTGVDLARLSELQAKADQARTRFEDAVTTAGISTAATTLIGKPKISVLSPSSLTPLRLGLGALGGLLVGIMLSVAPFGRRSERD